MTEEEELQKLREILAAAQPRIQARARRLASAFAARAVRSAPKPKPKASVCENGMTASKN